MVCSAASSKIAAGFAIVYFRFTKAISGFIIFAFFEGIENPAVLVLSV